MARAEKSKKPKSKHPLRDLIEMCVFAVVMALGLKVFAVEAYQIPTGSMMPTLMGTELLDEQTGVPNGSIHDRVLVDKLSFLVREPKRWEVVVFRYPLLTYQNYVKRLVGLPGEQLLIENGDIWARPLGSDENFVIQRKPADLQRRLWKQVWPIPGTAAEFWPTWDKSGEHSLGDDGELVLRRGTTARLSPIKDAYRHGFPASVRNRIPISGAGARGGSLVHDLRLQLEAKPSQGGPLEVRMDCGPFPLILTLVPAESRYELSLPDGNLLPGEFAMREDQRVSIDLAYWDQHFELTLQGPDGDAREAGDLTLPGDERARRNGIAVTAPEGGWSLFPPLVERDIHYLSTLQGDGSLSRPFDIPEGHLFMMGDNTQNSHDSRDWRARRIQLKEAVDGVTELKGDDFQNSLDPFFDNPRWNRDHTVMTFRDSEGELHTIGADEILAYKDLREPNPLVPREYLMGRALAVFLPLWPAVRVGLVR